MNLLKRWKDYRNESEMTVAKYLYEAQSQKLMYSESLIEIACKSVMFPLDEWENYIKDWFQDCSDDEKANIIADYLNGKQCYQPAFVEIFLKTYKKYKNTNESELISVLEEKAKNSDCAKNIFTQYQNWLIWLNAENKKDIQNKMYAVTDESIPFIPICLECGTLQFRTLSQCPCCGKPFNID